MFNLFGPPDHTKQIQQLYEFHSCFSMALLEVLKEGSILTGDQVNLVLQKEAELLNGFTRTRILHRGLRVESPDSALNEVQSTANTTKALNLILNFKLEEFRKLADEGPHPEAVKREEGSYRETIAKWRKTLPCKHDFENWGSNVCRNCKTEAKKLPFIRRRLFLLDELQPADPGYETTRQECQKINECSHEMETPMSFFTQRVDECKHCKTPQDIINEISKKLEKS